MPKIRQYTPQVSAPGPVNFPKNTSVEYGGTIAEGLGNLGAGLQKAGDVFQQNEEMKDVADVSAKAAQLNAEMTVKFHQDLKNADPSDRGFTQRFIDDYNKQMDALGDGVSTSKGRLHLQKLKGIQGADFYEKAMEGQSILAAEKAKTDHLSRVTALGNKLMLSPGSHGSVMQEYELGNEAAIASGWNRTALEQQKANDLLYLNEQMVRGQIQLEVNSGRILNKGNILERLNAHEFDNKVKDVSELINYATQYQDVRVRHQQTARQLRLQAEDDTAKQNAYKYQTDYAKWRAGKGPQPDLQKAWEMFKTVEHREYFLRSIEQVDKAPLIDNVPAYNRIRRQIESGRLQTRQEVENAAAGFLSYQSTNSLVGIFEKLKADPLTMANSIRESQFKDKMVAKIRGSGIPDVDAELKVRSFYFFWDEEVERLKQQGKNSSVLMNPQSPDYIEPKMELLSPRERMKKASAKIGGGAPMITEKPYGQISSEQGAPQIFRNQKIRELYTKILPQFGGNIKALPEEYYSEDGAPPLRWNRAALEETVKRIDGVPRPTIFEEAESVIKAIPQVRALRELKKLPQVIGEIGKQLTKAQIRERNRLNRLAGESEIPEDDNSEEVKKRGSESISDNIKRAPIK